MSSITITLSSICSGGNHFTYTVTGDRQATVRGELSQLTEPITDSEAEAFVKIISKMAKAGRTNAQARTLLQSGVTVTV